MNFKRMSYKIEGYPSLLTAESKICAANFIKEFKKLQTKDRVESLELLNDFIYDTRNPPLELLWMMTEEEVLYATTYFIKRDSYEAYFNTEFERTYSQTTDLDCANWQKTAEVISNLIALVINSLGHREDSFKTKCEKIINQITSTGAVLLDENRLTSSYLEDILNSIYIFNPCLSKFAVICLTNVLTTDTNYELPTLASNHKLWTSQFIPELTKEFILKLVALLSANDVVEVIEMSLKTNCNNFNMNYKFLFVILSMLVPKNDEFAELIKTKVNGWIKDCFDGDESIPFLVSLFIARHCWLAKARYFPNYIKWFCSLPLKDVDSYKIFFDTLSNLIPFETPLFLKMHVNKVPLPPNPVCQEIASDYVFTAKSRLVDYNESTEYLGIFNDYYETDKDSEADVDKVISYFSTNGEIPKQVIEASVFRKPYYEKIFLPRLLQVGQKEDSNRAQVIHSLHKLGKISTSMYKNWKSI